MSNFRALCAKAPQVYCGGALRYLVDPFGILNGERKALEALLRPYNECKRTAMHGHLIVAATPVETDGNALLYGAFPYNKEAAHRSILLMMTPNNRSIVLERGQSVPPISLPNRHVPLTAREAVQFVILSRLNQLGLTPKSPEFQPKP